MKGKGNSKQLIDRLIKKRRQENDAFIKLLSAMETKGNENHEQTKAKGKTKP